MFSYGRFFFFFFFNLLLGVWMGGGRTICPSSLVLGLGLGGFFLYMGFFFFFFFIFFYSLILFLHSMRDDVMSTANELNHQSCVVVDVNEQRVRAANQQIESRDSRSSSPPTKPPSPNLETTPPRPSIQGRAFRSLAGLVTVHTRNDGPC